MVCIYATIISMVNRMSWSFIINDLLTFLPAMILLIEAFTGKLELKALDARN